MIALFYTASSGSRECFSCVCFRGGMRARRKNLYPDTEANGEELVRTHLRPGPVPKPLSVVHGEQRTVLSVAEGRAGPLQEGLLLAQAAGQRSQHGHGAEQIRHIDSSESVVFQPEVPTNKYQGDRAAGGVGLLYSSDSLPFRVDPLVSAPIIYRVTERRGNHQLLSEKKVEGFFPLRR